MTLVKVHELVGENAITLDDGQAVYDRIAPALKDHQPVEVDFSEVEVFASPFFNSAAGQLLNDISPEELNRLVKFTNLNPAGKAVLKRVIENAKQYYASPDYRAAQEEALKKLAEED